MAATEGFAKLRRDFKRLAPETDAFLGRELYKAAIPIRGEARSTAPRLRVPQRGRRAGRLAGGLRIVVQRRGVAIVDRVPYANVIHWGGTTGRGHQAGVGGSGSVKVEPHPFVADAVEHHEFQVLDSVGNAVDKAARVAGWGSI